MDRQLDIISGIEKPTEDEMKLLPEMLKEDEQEKLESLKAEVEPKMISDYWLKVFKNCDVLDQLVEEKDEPVLKHLQKVTFTKDGINRTYHF